MIDTKSFSKRKSKMDDDDYDEEDGWTAYDAIFVYGELIEVCVSLISSYF